MDGAMILWDGFLSERHNSFLFLTPFDYYYDDMNMNLRIVIPGKSNNQEEINKFSIVFRPFNPDKKKLSSPQLTIKYPFKKSFLKDNGVTNCETKHDFWYTMNYQGLEGIKFYYSTITFNLSKLLLKDKKIYDISIKLKDRYFHKYYIVIGRKTEFLWTNYGQESTAILYFSNLKTVLKDKIGNLEEAERLKLRMYTKMIRERTQTQTPITQMMCDGNSIAFQNITDSILKDEPGLIEQLCDDPAYMQYYAVNKFELELGEKVDRINNLLLGLRTMFSFYGNWFDDDILVNIKPSQKSLANAVNYYNVRNHNGNDAIFTFENTIMFYTILKPLISELEKI